MRLCHKMEEKERKEGSKGRKEGGKEEEREGGRKEVPSLMREMISYTC